MTSFGQMENILNCGYYTIGRQEEVAMNSIRDVIRLTLEPEIGKKLLKTSYNLDELRDLESKLVLITGSKAENRKSVEQFLDVRMLIQILHYYYCFTFTDLALCVSNC